LRPSPPRRRPTAPKDRLMDALRRRIDSSIISFVFAK
jgi:hypothetical protein